MPAAFDSFVVFAEMRTGSNYLEQNLNALDGVDCHGEAFNPHFIGYPDTEALLGLTQEARDAAPDMLLHRIRSGNGVGGFRYFHDHDPRVLDLVLNDRRCAKIILTRPPLDSYISWKIAQATGQWKLTDVQQRKAVKAHVEVQEFLAYREVLSDFHDGLIHNLQASGQAAFRLTYDDLRSVEAINGIAAFLGVDARLDKLDQRLKVQNPEALASKVSNPQVLEEILAKHEAPDIHRIPEFEPPRVAAVPSFVLAAKTSLAFMPIRCGPTKAVRTWMADLDSVSPDALGSDMSQKTLRQWKRARPGHRSFTVVCHPVVRAYRAFCHHILGSGEEVYPALRTTLINRYKLPIPAERSDGSYDLRAYRDGFLRFLQFLRPNLNGQTAVRVDGSWCTQAQTVQGFARFAAPDFIFREDRLSEDFAYLAAQLGCSTAPPVRPLPEAYAFQLEDIYDEEIEEAAATAYHRDYMIFGFQRWR
ncbi:MAG: nodulation protein NodH [Pseudomonadota bacterium]